LSLGLPAVAGARFRDIR